VRIYRSRGSTVFVRRSSPVIIQSERDSKNGGDDDEVYMQSKIVSSVSRHRWLAAIRISLLLLVAPLVASANFSAVLQGQSTNDLTTSAPGFVEFRARLLAGAHVNVGSALGLSGTPSLGTLQIFKPAAGPGSPDLALKKTAPAIAAPGDIITYTLSYTNKPGS